MKKFDNFNSNLAVLSKAYEEDLENEYVLDVINHIHDLLNFI